MKQAIFLYKPDYEPIPRKGARSLNLIRLNPGRNLIQGKDLDILKKHPSYSWLKKHGALEEIVEKESVAEIDEGVSEIKIKRLTVSSAEKIIKFTYDAQVLDNWLTQETKGGGGRPGVLNAINRQKDDLKKGKLGEPVSLNILE